MADSLSVVGIVVGVGGLVFGGLGVALSINERGRRIEEVGLVRDQVEILQQQEVRAEAVARQERSADLHAAERGSSNHERGIDFTIELQNTGRVTATGLRVWLAIETDGVAPETLPAASPVHEMPFVAPGDDAKRFRLTQLAPFHGGRVMRPGFIVASWTDGDGHHRKVIGTLALYI